MSKTKQWKWSPLPFQGQKRRFIKDFSEALKEYPNDVVYIDLFGGSGLLSHTVKCIHPNAKVIFNDFDNFKQRLNAIPQTNQILEELRALNIETPREKVIRGKEREAVCDVLRKADEKGFVDWITLSSSLKFSMNYATNFDDLTKDTLYNSIRKSNYKEADYYLQGIEVVCEDYRKLWVKYKDLPNVVFLVDPPYLSTDTSTYNSKVYWKLSDYLDVVQVLEGNYFYFTSSKSHIVELMNWVETKIPGASPFTNAKRTTTENSTSHNSGYIDIMYYYKK